MSARFWNVEVQVLVRADDAETAWKRVHDYMAATITGPAGVRDEDEHVQDFAVLEGAATPTEDWDPYGEWVTAYGVEWNVGGMGRGSAHYETSQEAEDVAERIRRQHPDAHVFTYEYEEPPPRREAP